MNTTQISVASEADWARLRELCCLTGKSGAPIEPDRWAFFGEHWIGPYQTLRPRWSYVVKRENQVVGYLTGCPDTAAFESEKRFRFTLPLMTQVLLRRFPSNADTRRFIRRTLRLDASPESRFPEPLRTRMREEYPAHLHMNLDESARGLGAGSQLVERYRHDLRTHGVRGIHLYCGEKPVNFYLKIGFQELHRIEFASGVWVYAMGSKF